MQSRHPKSWRVPIRVAAAGAAWRCCCRRLRLRPLLPLQRVRQLRWCCCSRWQRLSDNIWLLRLRLAAFGARLGAAVQRLLYLPLLRISWLLRQRLLCLLLLLCLLFLRLLLLRLPPLLLLLRGRLLRVCGHG